MKRVLSSLRIAWALATFVLCTLVAADRLGLIPGPEQYRQEHLTGLAESIAAAASLTADDRRPRELQAFLDQLVLRFRQLQGAEFSDPNGLLLRAGDLPDVRQSPTGWASSAEEVRIPLLTDQEPWGELRLSFSSAAPAEFSIWKRYPFATLAGFVTGSSLLLFAAFLHRLLAPRTANTSSRASRLMEAADALAEPIVAVDGAGTVMLANIAFANLTGLPPQELKGRSLDGLGWRRPGHTRQHDPIWPWHEAMQANRPCRDELLRCEPSAGIERSFRVSATPITGDDQRPCGALVTWVETTDLEERRGRLCQAIENLTEDRANQPCEFGPADRDLLTNCLTRYGLYEQLEIQAALSLPTGQGLGLVLLGIDHFIEINHSFGRSGGDVVLRQVAESLKQRVGSRGVVSRFGADQFAVLCVAITAAECLELVDQLWQTLGQLTYRQRVLRFSVGWTWRPARDTTSQQLIQEAETALLAAKHSGRNQCCDYRALAHREDPSALTLAHIASSLRSDSRVALSARVTTALSALLELRAPHAAQRGRRLAHSCRLAAHGLMTAQDALVLEMAACLYPLGQIGWPEELLTQLAPPPAAMRPTMAFYDRVATNVIGHALGCSQVAEILSAMQMTQYGQGIASAELPQSARLLLIADEYDRIAFDSRGDRLVTPALAFQQLRQLAEHRLDKYLVEHFVEQLQADGTTRMPMDAADTGQLFTVQEQRVLSELREIRAEIAARERLAEFSLHTMQHAHLF